MKIMFALLVVSFFLFTQVQGQNKRWDARISMGAATYPFLQEGGTFLSINVLGSETTGTAYATKVLYQTNNRKIKVGLSAAYNNIQRYHIGFSFFAYDPSYLESTRKVFAVMPTFNYTYLKKRNIQLYSEACFGASFSHQKVHDQKVTSSSIHTAFQCTFLGYRLGNKIGFFTELGYGYEGILQVGISGTF